MCNDDDHISVGHRTLRAAVPTNTNVFITTIILSHVTHAALRQNGNRPRRNERTAPEEDGSGNPLQHQCTQAYKSHDANDRTVLDASCVVFGFVEHACFACASTANPHKHTNRNVTRSVICVDGFYPHQGIPFVSTTMTTARIDSTATGCNNERWTLCDGIKMTIIIYDWSVQ